MQSNSGRTATLKVGGLWMKFDLGSVNDMLIFKEILSTGTYESATSLLMKDLLQENDTFVDVGANIGHFTLLASSLVGESGKVYSLEPFDESRKKLESNVNLNHFHNVTIISDAAWNEISTRPFYISVREDGMNSMFPCSHRKVAWVKTTTLDSLLSQEHISVVKIDAEGAEEQVLTGARSLIEHKRIKSIIVEWNMSTLYHLRGAPLLDFFRSLGDVFLIGNSMESGYKLVGPITCVKDLSFLCNILIRPAK